MSATNPFLDGIVLGVDVAEFGREATLLARTSAGVANPSGRGEAPDVTGVEGAVLGRDDTGVEDALVFAGVFLCDTGAVLGDGTAAKPFFVDATPLATGEILLAGDLLENALAVAAFEDTGLAFGTGTAFARLFLFVISSVTFLLYSASLISVLLPKLRSSSSSAS